MPMLVGMGRPPADAVLSFPAVWGKRLPQDFTRNGLLPMNKSIDAIAAGHICLDITPIIPETGRARIEEILTPGSLTMVEAGTVALGGQVANTGLALKRFGHSVAALGGIGDDELGLVVQRLLERHAAAGAIRPAPGAVTSFSVVLAPPGIDRMFLHCPGANDTFGAENIDFDLVRRARLLHFGYPTLMRRMYADRGAELARIMRQTKDCDVTTSLDMSMPDPHSPAGLADWPRILEQTLPWVDLFLPSVEEIAVALEREDYLARRRRDPAADLVEHYTVTDFRRLADRALAMGCGVCVIKAGSRGFYLRSGPAERLARFGGAARCEADPWADRELWCPAYRIDRIASATGSGDCAIAGLLAGVLRGLAPERAMRLACAAGWHNLRALDPLSGLPDWAGLEAFVDSGPPVLDPRLSSDEFNWKPGAEVYVGTRDARR